MGKTIKYRDTYPEWDEEMPDPFWLTRRFIFALVVVVLLLAMCA